MADSVATSGGSQSSGAVREVFYSYGDKHGPLFWILLEIILPKLALMSNKAIY